MVGILIVNIIEMALAILNSDQKIIFFLILLNKFDFACSTTPQDAIRQQPKFFDFQEGVTHDVEAILAEIAKYHPDSHLF